MAVKKSYFEVLNERKYDSSKPAEKDNIHFVIQQNHIIGTSGNFVTFSGLPKAGKSTFISAAIASAISKRTIFDMNLFLFQDKPKIALFDTEQSNFDIERVLTRINKLAKIKDIHKDLNVYLLSEDTSTNIVKLIQVYLNNYGKETGIIIIDGLLDLVENMNNEAEAKQIIRLLKKWAKQHKILIICVLHLGKKENNTLGHVGSASDRYAQSTLKIERTKSGTLSCTPVFLRSAQTFNEIELIYNELEKNYYQYEK